MQHPVGSSRSDPSLERELPEHQPLDGPANKEKVERRSPTLSLESARPRELQQLDGRLSEPDTQLEEELPSHQPVHEPRPGEPTKQRHARLLATLASIAFFSIWGVLGRLGLVALTTYDDLSVFPVVWAQAVGCFVMGLCIGSKPEIESVFPPLFVGLTTGFCGSMTTFSTWIFDVWQAFANDTGARHHGVHNVSFLPILL
jgi:fluoride ion exporter CrcB/FEX